MVIPTPSVGEMKSSSIFRTGLAVAALVANLATTASAEAQPFKMTTPIAPGVATPDRPDRDWDLDQQQSSAGPGSATAKPLEWYM